MMVGDKYSGFYRDNNGTMVLYSVIARRIYEEHPDLVGKHIFAQLEALGMYDSFVNGTTPCGLPYSFTD